MDNRERRECKRFTLNHPVTIGTSESNGHLAEIVDAGVQGMRVRMTNQSGFRVGHDVDVSCTPQQDQAETIKLRCRVAWEDAENLEVGLSYLH